MSKLHYLPIDPYKVSKSPITAPITAVIIHINNIVLFCQINAFPEYADLYALHSKQTSINSMNSKSLKVFQLRYRVTSCYVFLLHIICSVHLSLIEML